MERVDFHIHYDPLEKRSAMDAIDTAKESGVAAMALIARDEIMDNFGSAISYGQSKDIEVIPGIESLGQVDGQRVGLICLGFDYESDSIKRGYGKLEQAERNQRIASLQLSFLWLNQLDLKRENMGLDDQRLYDLLMAGQTTEKAIHYCELATLQTGNYQRLEKLKRDNLDIWGRVVCEYSLLPNYQNNTRRLEGKFLYLLYFDVGMPGHIYVQERVNEMQLSVGEIISSIHEGGGVVLYSPEGSFSNNIWEKLLKMNVDGIMGWHGGTLGINKRRNDIPLRAIKDAREKGLLVLGGSDYQKRDWLIGDGDGNMFISPRRLREFTDYIKSKNNGVVPWKK